MGRFVILLCVAVFVLVLGVSPILSRAESTAPDSLAIEVAPNVLNRASQGSWVTVHTNIDFDEVDRAKVWLNGVLINWSKEDNRGDFVAKFVISNIVEAVKDIPSGGKVELRLVLTTVWGEELGGSDTVKVIDGKVR